jgi:transketolase
MGLAPVAYLLYTQILKHHPRRPDWFDRDRLVLSAGHASMLLYATLYLTGYDIQMGDLKSFRQWNSRTPGHPEHGHTPGVETTTGPLGQGLANAVGMAMAEAHMAARFNRPGQTIVDHRTYVICSDGDMMEGISHEAASLAGHLGLGKLVAIYDANSITIEGSTSLSFSEDVAGRFSAYGWQVIDTGELKDDLETVDSALEAAQREISYPTLIIVRSHIGYGAPTRQDSEKAHGEPLGVDEIRGAKRAYNWPEEAEFLVPHEVRADMGQAVAKGDALVNNWEKNLATYSQAYPELAVEFVRAISGDVPTDWHTTLPVFGPADGPMATRTASGMVISAIAKIRPWLVGGSADLAPSTRTLISNSGYFARGKYAERNIAWGVREHAMVACASGMALHGGIRPFVSTFFIFTDYARPAIRLATIMGLPVIYVMTHDSIFVGEDGPTHQPVEHLATFRAMPGLNVIRPADANETVIAWQVALERRDGPTMLVLSRQNLPVLDRERLAGAVGLRRGAYVVSAERGPMPHLALIASGSEVSLALAAQSRLAEQGVDARVVSMPCWKLFRQQSAEYRESVLPCRLSARLALEAASPFGWREWVGDAGDIVGVESFGASAPARELEIHYGFTVENIVERARDLLSRHQTKLLEANE